MLLIKRYIILVVLSCICQNTGNAQSNEVGSWLSYFGNQKINNQWIIQSDIQFRNYQLLQQRNQLLLRAGLGYNLKNQNNNLLVGYAYIASDNYDENNVNIATKIEHRVYQQYLYKNKLGNSSFSHRFRLEERFFASEFGLRARYFISAQIPLNKKEIRNRFIYFSTYNELFIDLKQSQFDRNRFFTGLGWGINDFIRLETGYMIQAQKNITRGQFQIILFNNLPFKKQTKLIQHENIN